MLLVIFEVLSEFLTYYGIYVIRKYCWLSQISNYHSEIDVFAL